MTDIFNTSCDLKIDEYFIPFISDHSFRFNRPLIPIEGPKVDGNESESLDDLIGIGGRFGAESVVGVARIMQNINSSS